MTDRLFKVRVLSQGVATVRAPSKAAAVRRARTGDFDAYELRAPEPQITSLAENEPIAHMLPPVERPVIFRTGGTA